MNNSNENKKDFLSENIQVKYAVKPLCFHSDFKVFLRKIVEFL